METVTKTAAEIRPIEFEFARALETTWLPGTMYAQGDFVRPTIPNGFEIEIVAAGDAGQSANDEPEWPTVIGQTIVDGSALWTVVDFGTNATDTITPGSQEVTPETGLTVSDVALDGTIVRAKLADGTKGQCYEVSAKVNTAGGQTLEEIITVVVT